MEVPELSNQPEAKSFWRTALAWHGSVTPRVLPRVVITAIYSAAVVYFAQLYPTYALEVTPFEYSGVVLGLLLVWRVNSGLERWWEARKIWGSIVNQSRNLALIGYSYSDGDSGVRGDFLHWVASGPYVMRDSLRNERELKEVESHIGEMHAAAMRSAPHMPTYWAAQIARLLRELRSAGLDDFAFHHAERERALLIDAIGACERIRSTPIPFVLAVKARRFILLFLLLLPAAFADRIGWLTPLVVSLAAYPLFSLDEIGAELQNPFSPRNLSHLPLTVICKNIEASVLSLENTEQVLVESAS